MGEEGFAFTNVEKDTPLFYLRNSVFFPRENAEIVLGFDQKFLESEVYQQWRKAIVLGGPAIFTGVCPNKSAEKTIKLFSGETIYSHGTMAIVKNIVETKPNEIALTLRGYRKCRILTIDDARPIAKRFQYFESQVQEPVMFMVAVQRFCELLPSVLDGMGQDLNTEQLQKLGGMFRRFTELTQEGQLDIISKNYQDVLRKIVYFLSSRYLKKHVSAETLQSIMDQIYLEDEIFALDLILAGLVEDSDDPGTAIVPVIDIESEPGPDDGAKNKKNSGPRGRKDAPKDPLRDQFEIIKDKMHPEARKEAERILEGLSRPGNDSDRKNDEKWLINTLWLPWGVITPERESFAEAEQILEDSHYGMKKVKERIADILATIRAKRKDNPDAPIETVLCFVGPPGVGKTSLGKSIAEAMGLKFRRDSLGGVRDEADIRGHRRTYIGAFPGKIMEGIRRMETSNFVYMLDEVDKLGQSVHGDPGAALMEVFDPEQNSEFKDHYCDFPYDISKILFICTANTLDTIPGPLQDRMEIIRLPGYFEHEKLAIAQQHLVPRQMAKTALQGKIKFEITDDALREMAYSYTWEAGVRNLEREIRTILRKINKERERGNVQAEVKIEVADLVKFLGDATQQPERVHATKVGEAIGLAFMSNREGASMGDILPIQFSLVPGRHLKEIGYTSSFGDVMMRSAKNAIGSGKIILKKYFPEKLKLLEETLIQVGSSSAATPKDGPSAGITFLIAFLSQVLDRPLKQSIAMTGELDGKFRVTAVGGIVEKVLGAERALMKEVILPKENEKDFNKLPDQAKSKIKPHFVETVEEVIPIVFGEDLEGLAKIYAPKTTNE